MSKAESTEQTYVLPVTLVGRADLSRLSRAVELVEADLQAQTIRNPGVTPQLTIASRALLEFIELNKLTITDTDSLEVIKKALEHIKAHAPTLHMTFASEVDAYILEKIVMWLRTEVHPQALVDVGLQPTLVGGVHIRTPNKMHDFSVKRLLKDKRPIIVEELQKLYAR